MAGKNPTNKTHIKAVAKQAKALELRALGWTLASIAKELGYADHTGARDAIRTALRKTLIPPAAELRKVSNERYDNELRYTYAEAEKPVDVIHTKKGEDIPIYAPYWKRVETVLKIEKQRAELLGLNRASDSDKAKGSQILLKIGDEMVDVSKEALEGMPSDKLDAIYETLRRREDGIHHATSRGGNGGKASGKTGGNGNDPPRSV